MFARLFSLAIVLAVCFVPAQAQNKPGAAPVKLAWHFTKGSEFHFRQISNVSQKMDMGKLGKSETLQKMAFHVKYEVQDVTDKGVATVKVTYLRGQLEMKDARNKETKFDTANPEDESKADEPVCKVVQAYIGNSFNYSIDATGHVLEVTGYDDLYKKLLEAMGSTPGVNPDRTESAFGTDSVKRQLELTFHMLPDEEVSKGDTWKRVSENPAPPLGTMRYDLTCTYNGMKKERGFSAAHISIESETTLVPAEKKEDEALKGMEFKLDEASYSGNYYFLPTSSQFLKAEFKSHMVISVDAGADMKISVASDTESLQLLLTQDDLKAEEAEIKALREDKKSAPPEDEAKPVPEPVK